MVGEHCVTHLNKGEQGVFYEWLSKNQILNVQGVTLDAESLLELVWYAGGNPVFFQLTPPSRDTWM